MWLFIDLNETLVRTGEVALAERVQEQRDLERFRSLCGELGRLAGPLELVILTGNTFEYARRVEEPIGVKQEPGVRTTIISENGLVARSFQHGDLWRGAPTPQYWARVEAWRKAAAEHPLLAGRWYSQGGEVRATMKPVSNAFSDAELAGWERLAEAHELCEVAQLYAHPFYVDVDPLEVVLDGRRQRFRGKAMAVERLLGGGATGPIIAVGDSDSDVPMFEAVGRHGGSSYWVANASRSVTEGWSAGRLAAGFASGVVELLVRKLAAERERPRGAR